MAGAAWYGSMERPAAAAVPVGCVHPASGAYRWIALVFMCILSFGSYYCYDNPAALEDTFTSEMQLSNAQYGLLYSVYSWPNVLLPFFGGYLIDGVLGLRFSAVLFSALIMIGQVAFASGALVNSFALMVFGRLIFALGGENLGVCQNSYAVEWFMGKEFNTVFGIQLSFARLGSTINLYVMKPLYDLVSSQFAVAGYAKLGITLMLGGVSTVVSFAASLVLFRMHERRRAYMEAQQKQRKSSEFTPAPSVPDDDEAGDQPAALSGVSFIGQVCALPASFWLLCVICVCYYVAIFPLVGFGLVLFENKYGLSPYPWSEVCNSLIYFISIVACAPCGLLVDKYGRNTHWMLLSVCLTLAAHALIAFTFVTPYIAMSLLGVAYSLLAASLWPCVAYIVPHSMTGTAYGIMQAVQNLGMAVFFWTAGLVLDSRGYFALELFFIAFLTVALAFTVLLLVLDSKNDGPLSKPATVRAKQSYESI